MSLFSHSRSATLHIHLDESGTLKFAPTASRYYIFAVVWTYNPRPLAVGLQLLRFHLLKQGLDPKQHSSLERFHASEDSPKTRDLVIGKMLEDEEWRFAAAIVQKNRVPPKERQNLGSFYSRFATVPLKFLLRGPIRERAHRLLIYTNRLPSECNRNLTEKAIKKACRTELPSDSPSRPTTMPPLRIPGSRWQTTARGPWRESGSTPMLGPTLACNAGSRRKSLTFFARKPSSTTLTSLR